MVIFWGYFTFQLISPNLLKKEYVVFKKLDKHNHWFLKILKGKDVDDWILNYGEMKVYMDMSNKLTGEVMTNKLRNLFFDFQKKVFADCHYPEKMVGVPLKKHFIYGDETVPATVFMTPGLVLVLVISSLKI